MNGDARYAAVTVGVIALGAVLIFQVFRGAGAQSKPRIIPRP